MRVEGGRMSDKPQLEANYRPADDAVYLDAFTNRYSIAIRRLRRATHSSLWDKSKPTSAIAADKKKMS